MLNLLQWPAMLVTVIAAWFVASRSHVRRKFGFWLFLASNVLWILWGVSIRAYALIALQVGLAFMNIRGERRNAQSPKMRAPFSGTHRSGLFLIHRPFLPPTKAATNSAEAIMPLPAWPGRDWVQWLSAAAPCRPVELPKSRAGRRLQKTGAGPSALPDLPAQQ